MPKADAPPPADSATAHLRARLEGRKTRLAHLRANYPEAAEAIAHVEAVIADLTAQLNAATTK